MNLLSLQSPRQKQKKVYFCLLVSLFLLLFSCENKQKFQTKASIAREKTFSLVLASTNGIRGNLFPYDYATNRYNTKSSLLALEKNISLLRKTNDHVLLMDFGNALYGNQMELFIKDDYHPIIRQFNDMKYDLWFLNQYDFIYDTNDLKRNMEHFKGNILTTNQSTQTALKSYKTRKQLYFTKQIRGDFNATFINLNTSITSQSKTQEGTKKILKQIITHLSKKYDLLVIVLERPLREKEFSYQEFTDFLPKSSILYVHDMPQTRLISLGSKLVIEQESNEETLAVVQIQFQKKNQKWEILGTELDNLKPSPITPQVMTSNKQFAIHERLQELRKEELVKKNVWENLSFYDKTPSSVVGKTMQFFSRADFVLIPKVSSKTWNKVPTMQDVFALNLKPDSILTFRISSGEWIKWAYYLQTIQSYDNGKDDMYDLWYKNNRLELTLDNAKKMFSQKEEKESLIALPESLYLELEANLNLNITNSEHSTVQRYGFLGRLPSLVENYLRNQL